MARPKLSSPNQPLLVRSLLRVFEFLASLKLAVLVISAVVVVLAWATYIDNLYGEKAAWFAIYGAWWFSTLLLLLGLNVLCAALIRFPWKRYQTGFVITHLGILVLLAGCFLSRLQGIDAQMPIHEGTRAFRAFEETQHFELTVVPAARNADPDKKTVVRVPFSAGPFNWDDYSKLFWFPWQAARRDRGLLYDQDGIRLEVLDYCSDAQFVPFDDEKPPLGLRVRVAPRTGDTSEKAAPEESWQPLGLVAAPHLQAEARNRASLPGGRQIVFWMAGSRAETEAFLDSRPKGPLGEEGLLVVHAAGRRFEFSPEKLLPNERVSLGDTGLELERAPLSRPSLVADLPILDLRVHSPGEPPRRVLATADAPDFNQHDSDHAVFATYWRGTKGGPQAAGFMGGPRIDLLQGADRQLYYRTWNAGRIEGPDRVPTGEVEMVAFENSGQALRWYVERFTPQDRPGEKMVPAPFRVKKSTGEKTRLARLRMTVDGRAEEFWLEGLPSYQTRPVSGPGQRMVVAGDGRRAEVTLRWNSVDLGFSVFLHEFRRGLDPGTSMASKYASRVDFVRRPPDDPPAGDDDPRAQKPPDAADLLETNVEIAVNRPKDFLDPATGRSYRLFQESFMGPWKPGDPTFDAIVGANPDRDRLFVSVLTVNYDPGRGLKYVGSLLVVFGVVVMFFMRAYFFKRRSPGAPAEETAHGAGLHPASRESSPVAPRPARVTK